MARKRILIKGGRVIDPVSGRDEVADIFIEGQFLRPAGSLQQAEEVIDATGLLVAPGFIDMHVHLREPGDEGKETIDSGAAAAVAGGFTSVACMPNTRPPIDNEASAEYVLLQAERAHKANIFSIGAVTKGLQGKELSEIGQLSRGGAVAFSDDGNPITDAEVMRRGLEYTHMFEKTLISHCEDSSLSARGVMHEGYVSMVLGLPGIPSAAEEVMVARDIILAQSTGGHVHIAHVSTAGAVDLVRRGKAAGVHVTAEATPHHFTLTDECVRTFDAKYKMNPPLRSAEDVEAVREGLRDGTIDAIATDHAPHGEAEKDVEFSYAPMGVIGLESAVPVSVTHLLRPGILPLMDFVAKFTQNPARILGLDRGTLGDGAAADVTILDLDHEWVIDTGAFQSRSRNCPFHGDKVFGCVAYTIVAGHVFKALRP
jgi:dihydroorotase